MNEKIFLALNVFSLLHVAAYVAFIVVFEGSMGAIYLVLLLFTFLLPITIWPIIGLFLFRRHRSVRFMWWSSLPLLIQLILLMGLWSLAFF